ncbi:hypothetical protein VPFG_00217 [Vibrio phage nt-1]|uniref:Uncharacterized protein n=1 Tax=Vibrio phage nt-1 TaxID=115992 RepID=R9TJE5_9CAUD|nr:hypothetical protein VPFG_00217 [Vibrio phage nt-1]AGN30217.1 hypothetical protein VPFG_00217 [Vibrio phage nt-1]
MNIDQTMKDYSRIITAIYKLLVLKPYQDIYDIEYDEDKLLFEVTIVSETHNGTEYEDAKITVQLIENYMMRST